MLRPPTTQLTVHKHPMPPGSDRTPKPAGRSRRTDSGPAAGLRDHQLLSKTPGYREVRAATGMGFLRLTGQGRALCTSKKTACDGHEGRTSVGAGEKPRKRGENGSRTGRSGETPPRVAGSGYFRTREGCMSRKGVGDSDPQAPPGLIACPAGVLSTEPTERSSSQAFML